MIVPSRFPALLKRHFCVLLAGVALGVAPASAYQRGAVTFANRPASEYEVKAGFLLNFLRFVEWPTPPPGQPKEAMAICIVGDDPFRDTLDRMIQGETVNGGSIAIRRVQRFQEPCQLLFVSASERDVFRILRQTPAGVLTVGETPGFLDDGGMVNFVVEDHRVRFDISLKNAAAGAVKISSRLLSVARMVFR